MAIQDFIFPRTMQGRIGLILLAFLLCILLPPWQTTTYDNETLIQYSFLRTAVVTALGACAAISFLWAAYKADSNVPPKSHWAIGEALLVWIVLVLPEVMRTKLTITSQSISLRDCHFWSCEEKEIALVDAVALRLKTIHEPRGGRMNNYISKTYIYAQYADGTNKSINIPAYMLTHAYPAITEIANTKHIDVNDERTE